MRYIPQLDGLRAIAILLVLAAHAVGLPGGTIGVDIFFVISGYLITAILLWEFAARSRVDIKAFYIRRFLRIVPAFAFMLLSISAMTAMFVLPSRRPAEYLAILYAATYVMNWTRAFGLGSGIVGHTWSLAVEEQFYLLWPLALTVFLATGRRRQIATLCVLVLVSTLWRAWLVAAPGTDDHVFFGSDARANQILVGCLLAFLPMHVVARLAARTWLVPAAVLGAFAVMGVPAWLSLVDSLVIALSAAWLIAAVHDPGRTLLSAALGAGGCIAIGRLSYSLYLWHAPILAALAGRRIVPPSMLPVIGILLSFAAATFSYFVVERPFLRLKEGRRLSLAADSPVRS